MDYLELSVDLHGKQAFASDIITAQLAEVGFESFTYEDFNYKAYVQTEMYDADSVSHVMNHIQEFLGTLAYTITNIETVNWNEQWESNFEPVEVGSDVIIRAPFHKRLQDYTYDIVIEPKMSFGTGHHETTYLVLQQMLHIDFTQKTVADCGCGTAVLGILASLMGAKSVYAFDYDPLCSENSIENAQKNNITNMEIALGGMDLLAGKQFDILLANINRNILTHNMNYIASSLLDGGIVIMSGFYEKDISIVETKAQEYGLQLVSYDSKNNWTTTVFKK